MCLSSRSYLQDLRPAALSALSNDEMTDYFRGLSTNSKLADWQFRQVVDALQLQPISRMPGITSVRCRSCWDMPMHPRAWCTRTY